MNIDIYGDDPDQPYKPKENCARCNKSLDVGMTLHNIPEHCKKRVTFPYVEIGDGVHFECYIGLVIDEYLKHKIEDKG